MLPNWDDFPEMPWAAAKEIIPLANSMKHLEISKTLSPGHIYDPEDVFSQERLELVCKHLTELHSLQVQTTWEPMLSFQALSQLTLLHCEAPGETPEAACVGMFHESLFPTTLRSFYLSCRPKFSAKDFCLSLAPLKNLVTLMTAINSVEMRDVQHFFDSLPKSLQSLKMYSISLAAGDGETPGPPAIAVNLPYLRSFYQYDQNIAQTRYFTFNSSPRLVDAHFTASAERLADTLSSLSKSSSRSTRFTTFPIC